MTRLENLGMRMLRNSFVACIGLLLIVTFAPESLSCDFPYSPSSELYSRASAIFVGKVVESPWVRSANGTSALANRGSSKVRFSVKGRLRGNVGDEVQLASQLSDCSYPFIEGETYLIHAVFKDGGWETGSPQRPILLADAGETLKYIEGMLLDHPQGLLYGHSLVRDREGKVAKISGLAILSVHLEGRNGHFQTRIHPTDYFEIVAPPGEYSAWLELNGKPVGERKTVQLTAGKATLQSLEGVTQLARR